MGRRLLLRWLKQPLVDADAIAARHDAVEAFVGDPEVRDTLRGAHLRALPDVERITRKLERRRAPLMDLCRLYQASAALPYIAEALERVQGETGAALGRRTRRSSSSCTTESTSGGSRRSWRRRWI